MMHGTALAAALAAIVLLAPQAGGASETIAAIKDQGRLQICMAESRPMAVRDPATGAWSGYNIDMARDLAGVLGVELEIVDQPYATIIPSLLAGRCEIVMAPLFANSERAQVVAFTDFYSASGLQVVVREAVDFTTWEELNDPDVTFAVAAATQDEATARATFPEAGFQPIVSDTSYAFFLELAAGRADAAMTDVNSVRFFLTQNPQMKLRVLEPERIANPTGRAYAVRPDDWHFVNFLNIWLAHTKDKYSQD